MPGIWSLANRHRLSGERCILLPVPSPGHAGKGTEGPGGRQEAAVAAHGPFRGLVELKLSFVCEVINTQPGGDFEEISSAMFVENFEPGWLRFQVN